MLIFLQIIIWPLAVSIICSPILRQVNTYNIHTGSLALEMEDSDRYTETEMYRIKLLRESLDDVVVKDYQRSDGFLIRWLRESAMDVNSANKSLRRALKWREENQMDFILNKTLPSIKKKHPCIVDGFDKRGGPILYFRGTGLNIRDLLLSGFSDALLIHFHKCAEWFFQAGISAKGTRVDIKPGIAIVDVRGAVLKQQACLRCVEFYCQTVMHINKYFPRISKLIVIINAPSFGRKVVEMMWPFLSHHHKQTIRVFGTDRKEWMEFLLSVISQDQLLQEYGGTKQSAVMRN